ncbi:MAG TPA: hypothetical protein VFZ08_03520 [Terriglobia bacterium]|nr:hypothetical protein [Terriglobia bacterium]
MKAFLIIVVVLALSLPLSLWAQTIETRASGESQIVRVRTALNHLTVIQLAEPVLSVAAGSEAFKVEWRGNKVFVEPTEAGVSTNLFIWTKSGRENYELEPAGAVASMDFAIDTPAADPPPTPKPTAKVRSFGDPVKLAAEAMLGGTPVRQECWKAQKHRVQVCVRDLFEQKGELYVRYSIENGTKKVYLPGTPQVVRIEPTISAAVLGRHAYTQLSGEAMKNLRAHSEASMAVVAHEARTAAVKPGEVCVGMVAVRLDGHTPAVVRLEFTNEAGHPVAAEFVM